MRPAAAAVAALLAAGTGGAWLLVRPSPGGDTAAAPGAAVPAAARVASPAFAFEEGTPLAWDIVLEGEGGFHAGILRGVAPGGPAVPPGEPWTGVSSRLRGTLHARFLRDGEGAWWIASRLDGEYLVDGARVADGDLLSRVFVVRAHPTGRLDRPRLARGLPEAIGGACRSVMLGMETVLPGRPVASWSAVVEDMAGRAEVRHRLLPGGSPPGFAVATAKVRYLSVAADFPPVGEPGARVLRSAGVARRGPGAPWISSVEREEEILLLSGSREFGRSGTRFTAVARDPDPALLPPSDLAEALASLDDPALVRRSILRTPPGLDPAAAVGDAPAAAAAFVSGIAGDYAGARDRLLLWLRREPGRAAALVRWLDAEGAALDPDRELALWGTIARAGTPESLDALASVLLGEDWSERSRFRALAHAGDPPLPTREYTDALWEVHRRHAGGRGELARALHASSAYALGALGGPDRPDREAASRIGGEIAAAFRAATGPGEREILLDAAGNHGGPEVLPALEAALEAPDPAVRARAFRAFRRMAGPAAEELLLRKWRAEPVASVRAAAMGALATMPPSEGSLAFAREAVGGPLAPAECLPLVGLLGATMEEHPGHAAILRALLARKPPREVRKEIYRFVLP